METIDQIQERIIAEFDLLGQEWLDKYDYLIELAATLPPLPAEHRTEQNLIKGCQSRVWLWAELDPQGAMHFSADSDAIITKGIIALLIRTLEGHTPQEVLDAKLYFIDRIGLSANLSPARANGLVAMIKQMKLYAMAFEAKAQHL